MMLRPAFAETGRAGEAYDWLNRIVQSAQSMNYIGTYTFSHDGKIETSRVTHVNDGEGERGKVEFLDGPPREILRENNQITCYYPENRLVKVDRGEGRHFFPGLISGSPAQLKEHYVMTFAGNDRVAGRECRVVRLEPKDGFRFAYRLCADLQSGLLLRAATEDEHHAVMQQFAFTEFQVEGASDARLKPSWPANGWLWDKTGLQVDNADNGIVVNTVPAGFRKIAEVRRAADGRNSPMVHLVYSDGLSSVSLFIEPARSGNATTVESRRGALSFYSWRSGEQQITAVGEVPPQAVAQFARAVSLSTKARP
jgi:sigma-E factor negative regulatory protein RseB